MAHWWTVQVLLLGVLAGSLAQFQSGFQSQEFPTQSFQDQSSIPPSSRVRGPQHQRQQPDTLNTNIPELPSFRRRQQQQKLNPQPVQQQFQQQPQQQFRQPPQQFQQQFQQPPQQQFRQPHQPQFQQPEQSQQFFDQSQDFQQQAFEDPAPASPQQPPARATPVRTSQPPPNPLRRPSTAPLRRPEVDEELIRQQNENAKYSFMTAVTDGIMDNQLVREEVRDGLKLKGVYSYSDGYYKRTVHYEADENGYRVVNEDVEPLGNGPQEDPTGLAEVTTNVGGSGLSYRITANDIPRRTVPVPVTDSARGTFPSAVPSPRRPSPQQRQQPQFQQQQFQQQQFQQQQYQDDIQ